MLPYKRRGRPFLLGEEVEMEVRAFLKALRANGASIAIGCTEGIIRNKDQTILWQLMEDTLHCQKVGPSISLNEWDL